MHQNDIPLKPFSSQSSNTRIHTKKVNSKEKNPIKTMLISSHDIGFGGEKKQQKRQTDEGYEHN